MSGHKIVKEYPNESALRLVFRYLNTKELHNVYLVCKYWCTIAQSEYVKRGPTCRVLTRRKVEQHLLFPSRIKLLLKKVIFQPSICMFATNDFQKYKTSDGCYCPMTPVNSISLWLDCPDENDSLFTLSSAFFPGTTNIEKKFLTFFCTYKPKLFYSIEAQGEENCKFVPGNEVKTFIDNIIPPDCTKKYCLIIWCKQSKFKLLRELIKFLGSWYQHKDYIIWGGTVREVCVCNRVPGSFQCRNIVDITFLFIHAEGIEAHIETLDKKTDQKKLIARKFRKLSSEVRLKDHSIAFMYTSTSRFEQFFKLESTLFKEYFPNVKLFHTSGREPFGAQGLLEFFVSLYSDENSKHTTLLLLTYK